MAKILYLSCHEILEYDEVRLFYELGHEVFSPGAYVEPRNAGNLSLRPTIDMDVDPDIRRQYDLIGAAHPGEDGKNYLTKEFVDNFDIVIVMHIPRWIQRNWDVMKHKRVIWRTIGQSLASTEASLKQYFSHGMEIVRYSPNEVFIPHFAGQSALIRFYKDPEDYGNWNGDTKEVITFCQGMEGRGSACNYRLFEQVTRPFPRKLFGPGNDQPGFGMGKVPYEQLLQEMRNNRVYFYTGTQPASYTLNFIESWMTGIPIVGIGPQHGNADVWRNHNLYEVDTLIEDGVTGFISDNPGVLHNRIQCLIKDKALARQISNAARKEALRHFSKDLIKSAWGSYLG